MFVRSRFPEVSIPDCSLTSFVFRHADRLADKRAIVDVTTGRSLTYGDLVQGAHSVGAALWQRGVNKGDVIAIFAPSVPEFAIAFYGATSVGVVPTTINPLATAGELAAQLADSGASILFTTPDLLGGAQDAARRTPTIGEIVVFGEASGATAFASFLATDGTIPPVAIDPAHDLAVLPYSSGTTGLPKGVMLTHRNLVANVAQVERPLAWGEEDVILNVPPFFHIYGILVLDLVLAAGATLVSISTFAFPDFLRAIEDHRVTRAMVVPPIVLALANSPIVADYDLSSLRWLCSGAAPLAEDVLVRARQQIDRAKRSGGSCACVRGYGLTEAAPVTHVQPFGVPQPAGTVGPAVANTECRIVDPETGADLWANEEGELWVRGPQVMRGYLNRPDATAETLTPDGWLRTGDLCRMDSAGNLAVVDRLKELIKYKGYQVAPAELEAILLGHPAVADAAVIPSPHEEAGEVPKAFVVLKGEALVSSEELMAYVAAQVAPYKRVRRLELIDQVPKSASGKILRRVLVERERAATLAPA